MNAITNLGMDMYESIRAALGVDVGVDMGVDVEMDMDTSMNTSMNTSMSIASSGGSGDRDSDVGIQSRSPLANAAPWPRSWDREGAGPGCVQAQTVDAGNLMLYAKQQATGDGDGDGNGDGGGDDRDRNRVHDHVHAHPDPWSRCQQNAIDALVWLGKGITAFCRMWVLLVAAILIGIGKGLMWMAGERERGQEDGHEHGQADQGKHEVRP